MLVLLEVVNGKEVVEMVPVVLEKEGWKLVVYAELVETTVDDERSYVVWLPLIPDPVLLALSHLAHVGTDESSQGQ